MHIQQSSLPYSHPNRKNTPTPHHPSRNIHVVDILPVQGYRLSDCHFTWDSPEISFTLGKQRPDQFNLVNISLKNICCFIGKTHVYEAAGSLTFFIIHSSLPVGEAEIFLCLRSMLNMLFYPGKLLVIQKKGPIYTEQGKSKHWGHLFANSEPLGQNELKDLKFCVDRLVKFQTYKINYWIDLLLLLWSLLEYYASKCHRPTQCSQAEYGVPSNCYHVC